MRARRRKCQRHARGAGEGHLLLAHGRRGGEFAPGFGFRKIEEFHNGVDGTEKGLGQQTARRAAHVAAPQEKKTTVAELIGIKIAHTIGCNQPAAAMLTPTRL